MGARSSDGLRCDGFLVGECTYGAHGVVVSHPLRMRQALGSNPSVSIGAACLQLRRPRRYSESCCGHASHCLAAFNVNATSSVLAPALIPTAGQQPPRISPHIAQQLL